MHFLLKHPFLKSIIFLIVAVLLPLVVWSALQRQDTRQRASETPYNPDVPTVTFYFDQTPLTKPIGQIFDVFISIDTGTTKVSGVDYTFVFDNTKLEFVSFIPIFRVDTIASTYENVAETNASGSFRYAIASPSESIVGRKLLATVQLKAKAAGQGSVTLRNGLVVSQDYAGVPLNIAYNTIVYDIVSPEIPTPTPAPTTPPTATSVPPTATPVPPTATPVPPTSTPIPPTATTAPRVGDATGEGDVNILDYNIWLSEVKGSATTKRSDFNNDGKVDLLDFSIWKKAAEGLVAVTIPPNAPTSPPTLIPQPTAIPTNPPQSASILPASPNYKRVFKTSEQIRQYNGNFVVEANSLPGAQVTRGLNGADKICQHRATSRNLGGTWKAWLSDTQTAVAYRFEKANVPYKLLNGTTIANNWTDLTDGNLLARIDITEFGVTTLDGPVWTGTLPNSTSRSTDINATCYDWSSSYSFTSGGVTSGYTGGQAYSYKTDFEWTNGGGSSCASLKGIYCFEQ
jgi:hypothetical protein